MQNIIKKYEDLSESIQNFFKQNMKTFDEYIRSSYSVETLLRLNMIINKEILFNKNILKNENLLREKDFYITENICNKDDVKSSLKLLFEYIEGNINNQEFANKSLINDLECSLDKNNVSEFATLINRIKNQSLKEDFKYLFVKEFIEDVSISFNSQDNFGLFANIPSKYEKYHLDFNEVELLVRIREFSKENNLDKKSINDFIQEEKVLKRTEEIANILKTNREQGFYTEVSFVLNNKPYLYVYSLETKTWNKDKCLVDDVLRACEKLLLNKIVQNDNIAELKNLIILNEKREILGQKYLNNSDFKEAVEKTINQEIIKILNNPDDVIQEDKQVRRKRNKHND